MPLRGTQVGDSKSWFIEASRWRLITFISDRSTHMSSAVTNGNGTAAHAAPIVSPLPKPPSVTETATVSLVIPVRNEARNIAWVLEQIADDVTRSSWLTETRPTRR